MCAVVQCMSECVCACEYLSERMCAHVSASLCTLLCVPVVCVCVCVCMLVLVLYAHIRGRPVPADVYG